uniref:Matrilin-2 n=1 Tax=Halisarca dujardinii TaxID=2583056 RepID=A0AA96MN12_HALDU|nr:matrilin-2 [Halisarca dujardinii]
MRALYLFATFFVVLTTAPMISQGQSQYPCDSYLRDYLPSLFTHCASCNYSAWSSWIATGQGKIVTACSTQYAEQFNRTRTGSSACTERVQYQTIHRCSASSILDRTAEQVATTMVNQLAIGAPPPTPPTLPTVPPTNSTTLGKRSSGLESRKMHPSLNRHRRQCDQTRYFVLVLDTSGSINSALFHKQTEYLATIVESLCGTIKVAMITYSTGVHPIMCFDFTEDKVQAAAKIRAATYISGGTDTAGALKYVKDTILQTSCGWTPSANDEKHLNIITLTDGAHNSDSLIPSLVNQLGQTTTNTELYAIAYGNVYQPGIAILVKNADTKHIFNIDAFDQQTETTSKVAKLANLCLGYHGVACR